MIHAGDDSDYFNGGTEQDTILIHFDGVRNLATDMPVRVLAEFSKGAWAVVVDGINGPRLANYEHRQIAAGDAADRIAGGRTPIRITGAGGQGHSARRRQ